MTDKDLDYSSVPLKFVGKMECRAFGSQNKDHALIKQLGEALKVSQGTHKRIAFNKARQVDGAIISYNNYLRERGG